MKRFALLVWAVILMAGFAIGQMPKIGEFSADVKMKSKDMTATGKMYMGRGKVRMDMNSQGMEMRMITDTIAKKGYMVMMQPRMYMEMDLSQPQRGPMGKGPDVDLECDPDHYKCTKVGSEMMNDRMCDKWQRVALDKGNEKENQTSWIDQQTGMPIRVVKADGSQMDFMNIKAGKQDPSLFEIPSGFQKMEGMGMGMGMGMGGAMPGGRKK